MHAVFIDEVAKNELVRRIAESRGYGLQQSYRVVSRISHEEAGGPRVVKIAIIPRTGYLKVVTSVMSGWPFLGSLIERMSWSGASVRYIPGEVAELEVWRGGRSARLLLALRDERWTWYTRGDPLAFESTLAYRKRRIRDRLTGEMLERYLAVMGYSEHVKEPNKAPEPTTFAVTSRAIVRLIEMKQQNPNRDVARAAPAKVVAHL